MPRAQPDVIDALLQLPKRVLLLAVRAYRLLLSPWVGNVCRYYPSCSQYALDALHRHGALGGSALAAWRVLRCNPWSPGGCDPVPERHPFQGLFTRLPLTTADDLPESKKLP